MSRVKSIFIGLAVAVVTLLAFEVTAAVAKRQPPPPAAPAGVVP